MQLNKLFEIIDKITPFFERISRNKYLRAVRDGFFSGMPIILFSSIFMLIAYVPNVFGFHWSESIEQILTKPHTYSMGIFSVLVTGTVAKNLSDSFNTEIPKDKQINSIATMLTSIIGFLLVAVESVEGGFSSQFMGSKGLLVAFLVAFSVSNIFKFFVLKDITISLPKEVPPNLAQSFIDLIPFSVSIVVLWLFDLGFTNFFGSNFAHATIEAFQPLFTMADGYLGLAIIFAAIPFFSFIGVHGASIVEPAIITIYILNNDLNLELFQAGEHASHVATKGLQSFAANLGGSGSTLVLTLMFAFLAKSKRLNVIGKASAIPGIFNVNEPVLYGAPIVLNPTLFIPYVFTPVINAWIFKFFVDVLKMDSFMYILPWPTPGPLGILLGTSFAFLSMVFLVLILVVDFAIYYPFFKAYDNQLVALEKGIDLTEEENENSTLTNEDIANSSKTIKEGKRVLVLCAGAGTSGLLANALNTGSKESDVNIKADAAAYGTQVMDRLKDYDLIILAPQVASNYEDMKRATDRVGTKIVATEGEEYINLTRDPKGAIKFVLNQFHK